MPEPDHLAKAVKAVFRPTATAHSFQEYSTKTYSRICGRIAQFLSFGKSAWGSVNLNTSYLIMLLVPPREFIGSVFAGRLPHKGKPLGTDAWWKSKTPELALKSVEEICERFETVTVPLFNQSSSLSGLIDTLKPQAENSPNIHFKKEVGCALVCDGRLEEGSSYLRRAEKEYRDGFHKMPTAKWMENDANHMKALVEAILLGRHNTLLAEWFQSSVKHLKIDKKWKSDKVNDN
jgi:hypothetical protein